MGSPEHFEGLCQTELHAIEGRGHCCDLIAALHRQGRRVRLALTDAVSSIRHKPERPNHDELNRGVENDDGGNQSANQIDE
jgi:hypothetical protein